MKNGLTWTMGNEGDRVVARLVRRVRVVEQCQFATRDEALDWIEAKGFKVRRTNRIANLALVPMSGSRAQLGLAGSRI